MEAVAAGAEKGALGDADAGFNRHRGEREDVHLLAEPDVIAHAEAPGKGDVHEIADDHAATDRSIDVQVMRLRKLIEADPAQPRHIQTVWGQGYVFVPDGQPQARASAPAEGDGA